MRAVAIATVVFFVGVPMSACVGSDMSRDATVDVAADGTPVVYCSAEANEDCMACYENVGRCCYMDPTISGQIQTLVANCNAAPDCRICCNECASMSCDTLRATHRCPI